MSDKGDVFEVWALPAKSALGPGLLGVQTPSFERACQKFSFFEKQTLH